MSQIHELPTASTIAEADYHIISQGGITKKVTQDVILDSTEIRTDNTFGEGLIVPTVFTNGFQQAATNTLHVVIAGYKNRAVYFRGNLDCSAVTFTPGTFTQAFRLPSNARPKVESTFFVSGSYGAAIALCKIDADGYVYFKNNIENLMVQGIIIMSAINYYIDPF